MVHQPNHETRKTEAILQRMGEIRLDLDEGVQDVVEQAREMRDWRTHLKSHPWVFVGAAVAAGCIIIPRRPDRVDAIAKVQSPVSKSARILGFVGTMVLREVVSYVGRCASQSPTTNSVNSNRQQTHQDIEP